MEFILHILRKTGLLIVSLLIALLSVALLICAGLWVATPIYEYPAPAEFSGKEWYNPYKGLDNMEWHRGNFQAHSKQDYSLNRENGNTDEQVYKAYRDLGYEFATLTNSQEITERSYYDFPYIPAQEYGINLMKTHLLLIGSYSSVFLDQPLFQGINTKQYRILRNRADNEIIALSHASRGKGFTEKDMKRLCHYDLLEVLNPTKNSIEYWDIALSSGRPVFLIADDDVHDVFQNREIGMRITMIPHTAEYARFIYNTLREGSTYGIHLNDKYANESRPVKRARLDSYAKPVYIHEDNDSISIRLSQTVAKIEFITDNGRKTASYTDTDSGSYKANAEDSYVRIAVYEKDGSFLLFNPLLRSVDGDRPAMPAVEKNRLATNLKVGIALLGLIIVYIYLRRKITSRRRR